MPCFLSIEKWSSNRTKVSNGKMKVWAEYRRVSVDWLTLLLPRSVRIKSVPMLGKRSLSASGVAVTILVAQYAT
jgi:hypothetical protein